MFCILRLKESEIFNCYSHNIYTKQNNSGSANACDFE